MGLMSKMSLQKWRPSHATVIDGQGRKGKSPAPLVLLLIKQSIGAILHLTI